MKLVSLRKINHEDRDIILFWRNDPEIISYGTTQNAVSQDEHNTWFAESLLSNYRLIFIIEYNNKPIGQIRFDKTRNSLVHCFISIYLFSHKNMGIGTKILKNGIELMCEDWNAIKIIVAEVLTKNINSQKFFQKNGFILKDKSSSRIIYHLNL
ncbi:GNAT family N-acetyltransferase [Flavobacteriaceae bacterium]|nr:GNAT family N-acetyltransferase [Flavobacteriaceae bacterium]